MNSPRAPVYLPLLPCPCVFLLNVLSYLTLMCIGLSCLFPLVLSCLLCFVLCCVSLYFLALFYLIFNISLLVSTWIKVHFCLQHLVSFLSNYHPIMFFLVLASLSLNHFPIKFKTYFDCISLCCSENIVELPVFLFFLSSIQKCVFPKINK